MQAPEPMLSQVPDNWSTSHYVQGDDRVLYLGWLLTAGTANTAHPHSRTHAAESSSAIRSDGPWSVCYRGHCNVQTIKDVSFVGPDQQMVAAGGDDGRMFLWQRTTGVPVVK